MSDVKRIIPYLGASHDRLSGRSYVTQDLAAEANVTVSFRPSLFVLSVCTPICLQLLVYVYVSRKLGDTRIFDHVFRTVIDLIDRAFITSLYI